MDWKIKLNGLKSAHITVADSVKCSGLYIDVSLN